MKLHIVQTSQGLHWLKSGWGTFKRQPFGLTGLFALGLTLAMLLGWVPFVGDFLSLAVLPTLSLIMMLGSHSVAQGHFPMPTLFLNIWQTSKTQRLTLLKLGLLYAAAILLLMGLAVWSEADTLQQWLGEAALGSNPQSLVINLPKPSVSMLLVAILMALGFLLISLTFWHAPALIYWHNTPLLKSLFFSLLACLRNWRAYLLFGLVSLLLIFACTQALLLVGIWLGGISLGFMLVLALVLQTIISIASYYAFCSMFGAPLTIANHAN